MPWKIVNLDYECAHAHRHVRDPGAPIHLRTYFDGRVEIGIGAEEPDRCAVRATVSRDAVVVRATRFQALDVKILESILASLDVEPHDRREALAWMRARMSEGGAGPFPGNLERFSPPEGWPYELEDEALIDSLRDDAEIPGARRRALEREAARRGIRVGSRAR